MCSNSITHIAKSEKLDREILSDNAAKIVLKRGIKTQNVEDKECIKTRSKTTIDYARIYARQEK